MLAALARVLLVLLAALALSLGWQATITWVPVPCSLPPDTSISLDDAPDGKLIAMTEPGEELGCFRTVEVGQNGLRWLRVRAAKATGWTLEANFGVTPRAAAQEQSTPTATPLLPPPTVASCRQLRLREKVVGSDGSERQVERLHIRAQPRVNASVIATIGHTDVVTDTGQIVEVNGVRWTEVQLGDGRIGWARAVYIEAVCR